MWFYFSFSFFEIQFEESTAPVVAQVSVQERFSAHRSPVNHGLALLLCSHDSFNQFYRKANHGYTGYSEDYLVGSCLTCEPTNIVTRENRIENTFRSREDKRFCSNRIKDLWELWVWPCVAATQVFLWWWDPRCGTEMLCKTMSVVFKEVS